MKLWQSPRSAAGTFAAALLLACAAISLADGPAPWPTHSVRIVVGYAPGSSPDTLARLLADPLGRALGKTIVVENKPGAAGNLGVETVVTSTDRHTIGFTTFGPLTTSKLLAKKLPYDPARDVRPISLLATSPLVLVCDSALPPTSLTEFVAWAKGQVHGVTYGSVGLGSGSHLMMESFARKTHFHLAHVPYQRTRPIASVVNIAEPPAPRTTTAWSELLPREYEGTSHMPAVGGEAPRYSASSHQPEVLESGSPWIRLHEVKLFE
jgi:tripartite-type tricarboxylate transporter receptor subunit TctC